MGLERTSEYDSRSNFRIFSTATHMSEGVADTITQGPGTKISVDVGETYSAPEMILSIKPGSYPFLESLDGLGRREAVYFAPQGVSKRNRDGALVSGRKTSEFYITLSNAERDALGVYRDWGMKFLRTPVTLEQESRLHLHREHMDLRQPLLHSYTPVVFLSYTEDLIRNIPINWAQPSVEAFKQKYNLENPIRLITKGQTTIEESFLKILDIEEQSWATVTSILDSFHIWRTRFMETAPFYLRGKPSAWARKQAEQTKFMFETHPALDFLAQPENIQPIKQCIDELYLDKSEEEKIRLKRMIDKVHAVAKNPSFFSVSDNDLTTIYQTMIENLATAKPHTSWLQTAIEPHTINYFDEADVSMTSLLVEHVFALRELMHRHFAHLQADPSIQLKMIYDMSGVIDAFNFAYYADHSYQEQAERFTIETGRRIQK